MMEEEWRDIDGYEGLYQVSNLGRVRSFWFGKVKMLKSVINGLGYKIVVLSKDKKQKTYNVHGIVAKTFLPNPNNLKEVNHKDEDKTNNCVDNLEWCDRKYNMNFGTLNERLSEKKSLPVLQFTKDGKFIKEYSSAKEVQRQIGIYQGNISKCCNNKPNHKSAGGFIWRFKNCLS